MRKVVSIRLDEGVYQGWSVPGDYDPLLSKLIAWGADRGEALARLRRALHEFAAAGIKTNLGLFREILVHPDFLRGDVHTRWLDERLDSLCVAAVPEARTGTVPLADSLANSDGAARNLQRPPSPILPDSSASIIDAAAIAAALWHYLHTSTPHDAAAASRWKLEGRREQHGHAPGSDV